MPEGPEIRLAADNIEAVLKNQEITKISFGLPNLKRYEKPLTNQRVLSVETRGKALLTHFDNGLSVYSHNQLYGVWKTVNAGKLPNTNRQLRFAMHTDTHSALLYSASDISVWKTDKLSEHPFLAKLGPDILMPTLNWQEVAERLQNKSFSNRALASIYLDQSFLAGLGNYLRSEILFVAGVNPSEKPRNLPKRRITAIAKATIEISRRSYATRGITIPIKLYNAQRKEGFSYERSRFFVFGRASKPCRLCMRKIERNTINSRRIYICSTCQRPERDPNQA